VLGTAASMSGKDYVSRFAGGVDRAWREGKRPRHSGGSGLRFAAGQGVRGGVAKSPLSTGR
jgi:hypothetical protein